MKQSAAETWSAVHLERYALFEDLKSLTPDQWAVPSLCPGWDVHDVLAHLIDSAKTTRLGFIRRLIAARFDFDKDNAVGVFKERRIDTAATLEAFGEVISLTSTPPADLATRLVEAYVHGEDIRRVLGIQGKYPVRQVLVALAYQLRTSSKMGGGKETAEGWKLIATDADFEVGQGPAVRASSISLLMAVSGRPVAAEEFTGAGAAAFFTRITS